MGSETHRIEIFKVGRHTDMNGTVVDFTTADADALVAGYDAATFEAPAVVGHPKDNDPAYGWVKGLAREGDTVFAELGDIDPAFAELVQARRYAKVSASLYPPNAKASPTPGCWYLKHVGFLGAMAPAVKGLKPVHFSTGADDGALTFQEDTLSDKPKDEDQALQFAEREKTLAEREKAQKAREDAFAAEQAEIRHKDHLSFAEGLVKSARLKPAGKDIVVGLLDQLTGAAPDVLNFGEGDEAPKTGADALRALLDTAAPLVQFGEVGGDKDKPDPVLDGEELGNEARAFMESQAAKGITIDAATAVRHVQKKGA